MNFLQNNWGYLAIILIAGVPLVRYLRTRIGNRTNNPNPPQTPQQAPAQAPAQQATPATPANTPVPATPTPTATPATPANTTPGTLVPSSAITGKTWWAVAIIGLLILIPLSFWPIVPWISLLVLPLLVLVIGRLLLLDFLTLDPAKAKEKMLRLIGTVGAIGVLIHLGNLATNYVPTAEAQGIGTKIGSFFTPVPPEEKWDTICDLVVPASTEPEKAPEVTIPYRYCNWRLRGVLPDPDGRYEVFIKDKGIYDYSKSYKFGGGVKDKLPDLGSDLKFKARSLEDHDVKIRVLCR